MPEVDILPNPKRDTVRANIIFEEPLSMDVIDEDFMATIENRLKSKLNLEAQNVKTYGVYCYTSSCKIHFNMLDGWNYLSFKKWLSEHIFQDMVGASVYYSQAKLLGLALPNNDITQLDILGANLPTLQSVGTQLLARLQNKFPEAEFYEDTSLSNNKTQISFDLKQDILARLGITRYELIEHLQILTDGVFIGNYFTGEELLPFYVKTELVTNLKQLKDTLILSPNNGMVFLSRLVDIKLVQVPEIILRVNGEISVSLTLVSPQDVPMGRFLEEVKSVVNDVLKDSSKDIYVQYRGSADNLSVFLNDFILILLSSLIILTILMWLSLGSLRLAFGVILSMPVAILGGLLALHFIKYFTKQNLDVITMFGFIILMGLVINNAILFVNNFKTMQEQGRSQLKSIIYTFKMRKRPIYMSTLTSILGMIPLVFGFGNSGEIYRGLAAVIVGGMTFSALFTILYMVSLLSLPIFSSSDSKR